MRDTGRFRSLLAFTCLLLSGGTAAWSDDSLTGGPAWRQNLVDAVEEALRARKALVIVFTVDNPQCAALRQDIGSNANLRQWYSRAVWLEVPRKSNGEQLEQQRVERIERRFGSRFYPNILLVNPANLAVIHSDNSLSARLLARIDETVIDTRNSSETFSALREADRRSREFQRDPTAAAARPLLLDPDPMVAGLALSYLVDREPQFAAPHAVKFLSVPQLRTDACRILAMYPTPEAAVPLTELVRNPPGDNPNAVRSMAVLALGACGDADAVAVIKPYASRDYQNILSAQAIRALARIAGRHPEMRPRVRQVLMRCFPDFETGDNDRSNFAVRAFARDLNEALASCYSTKIPFPDQYDHKSGRKLQQRWSAVIDAEGREKPAP